MNGNKHNRNKIGNVEAISNYRITIEKGALRCKWNSFTL